MLFSDCEILKSVSPEFCVVCLFYSIGRPFEARDICCCSRYRRLAFQRSQARAGARRSQGTNRIVKPAAPSEQQEKEDKSARNKRKDTLVIEEQGRRYRLSTPEMDALRKLTIL